MPPLGAWTEEHYTVDQILCNGGCLSLWPLFSAGQNPALPFLQDQLFGDDRPNGGLHLPADLCRQLAIRFLTTTAALDLDVDRRVDADGAARG